MTKAWIKQQRRWFYRLFNFIIARNFDFDIANPTGDSLLKVLLDQLEKLEEKFLLKGARENKLYSIKNYSLNGITFDDHETYTHRRTTNTNYFVTWKPNSTEIKAQIV